MPNLQLAYRYCDGSRFCNYGAAIFANPTGIAAEGVMAQIADSPHAKEITRDMGLENVLFDPTAFGLPEFYFEENLINDLDWHELLSAEPTEKPPTDPRTVAEFLADVAAAPPFRFRDFDAYGQLTR